MEEILGRRYDERSPSGGVPPCSSTTTACSTAGAFNDGETRAQFDDVDDYNGLVEQPPRDVNGNPRPDYDSYRVAVSVAYATPAQVAQLGLDAADRCKARNRDRFDAGERSVVVQRIAGQLLMAGGHSRRAARVGGFTLIELVVVITVMGILSIGAVSFITDASDGYANTVRRTELGSTMRLAAERVTRELRNALPNSVRVSGNCLEFIPVEGGSTLSESARIHHQHHLQCGGAD